MVFDGFFLSDVNKNRKSRKDARPETKPQCDNQTKPQCDNQTKPQCDYQTKPQWISALCAVVFTPRHGTGSAPENEFQKYLFVHTEPTVIERSFCMWANQERSPHERTILRVKSYSIQSCVRGISIKSKVKTIVFSLCSLMTQSHESTFCKCAYSSQNSWIVSDFLVASFITY